MTDKYREISLSWVPDGYTNVIEISDDIRNKIGTFKSMRVNYVVTPITFYAISDINNKFLLSVDGGTSWNQVELTIGNYTSIQFAEELKSKLDSAPGGYTYTIVINPGGTITISIDSDTFRIAFIKSKQTNKIWGMSQSQAGDAGVIENPPSSYQINNVAADSYTSVEIIPNEIEIYLQNKLFILYETSEIVVNLTEGVYTREEFIVELANKLNTAGAYTYTVSIDISGKLIISSTDDFQIAFIENVRSTEKIWGISSGVLGAKLMIQNPPTDVQITGATYTSTNPIQLWGPDKLLIVSEALENQFIKKNIDITQNTDDVIFSIPITVSPLTQQTYFNPNVNMTLTSGVKLPRKVDMNITDESGNGINFNGGECYVNLIVS